MKPIPTQLHSPLRHVAVAIFLTVIAFSALFALKVRAGQSHDTLMAELHNQRRQLAEQQTELESLQALKQQARTHVSRIARLPTVDKAFGSTAAGKARLDEQRLSGTFAHEAALLAELEYLTQQPGAAVCIRRCEIRLVSQNSRPVLAADCSLLSPGAMVAID